MPTFDWNMVPVLRRDRIADAEAYAEKLNHGHTFHAWLHVGAGLVEWRDAALELAGTQDTATPAYRAAWKTAKPNYPHLTSIAEDKAVRSYAIWMSENRVLLEAWYAGLGNKERRNWNHPRTIWNHSPLGQVAKAAKRAFEEPKPRKTAVRDLFDAVGRISEVADNVERTYGGASQLAFDMSPERIGESADNFVDIYGKEDTNRFIDELIARVRPPAVQSPPLDPTFAASVKKPQRKRQVEPPTGPLPPIEEQIRSLRAAHPEWSHKEIGKAVKRASSIVARVLGEDPPSTEQITERLKGLNGKTSRSGS